MPYAPNFSDTAWKNSGDAWLAAIVESSDDAIIGKTLDSVIRSWNRGATRIFGYSAEEAIGRPVLMLIPPERHHEEQSILARLARGERVDHFETIRIRKDGSRVDVSLSVSPICDGGGAVLGAAKIARDVTETNRLRKAESDLTDELQTQAVALEQQIQESRLLQQELGQTNVELREAIDAARVAQKQAEHANRAKSQFLATMSHELRTPLNAIAGYVDLMQLGLRGPITDQQRADLERVKCNQRTLLRLIDDVLGFAKFESGRLEFRIGDVAIDELLRTLEMFVAPSLTKKNIAYHFESCGLDAVARADRDKVEQIMLNLLSNAVKFTESGKIVVRCRSTGAHVEIDVIDTGRGIQAELLESIFEPFVRGEHEFTRTVEGTGLGLSISRSLARAMNGDVVATSAPGCGSTFTLILPKAS